MDIIRDELLSSLHNIACARFNTSKDKSKIYVDYDKEVIVFEKDEGRFRIVVNCSADSESAAVIDFCKVVI